MAKHKSSSKKKTSKKPDTKKAARTRRQTAAIFLFAGAVLLLCILLIKGESLWGSLRRFFYGVFGFGAFLLPIISGYVAVVLSMEKPSTSPAKAVFKSTLLLMLLTATVHIFITEQVDTYKDALGIAFDSGVAMSGDCWLGAAVGFPLRALFDDVGSKVVSILLIFVYMLLVTGSTIISFFKALWKPVKKTKESIETTRERNIERRRINAEIDVEMGEGYPEGDSETDSGERVTEENSATDLAIDDIIKSSENDEDSPFSTLQKAAQDMHAENSKPLVRVDDLVSEKPRKSEKAASKEEVEKEAADVAAQIDNSKPAQTYRKPPLSLLDEASRVNDEKAAQELRQNAETLVNTLQDFGVSTRVVAISRGPSVTRYELEPSAGVKISRITNLADDIALRLATTGVRIEAPIPNKAAVGIEVPNRVSNTVCLRELLDSEEFRSNKSKLTVALGRDIAGKIVLADLAKMPHLLIAGTTGSGKSVCTNSMIQSILYNASPEEVRMLLIDPKQVEFGVYNGIPHLLVPVVTNPRKAAGALNWAVTEMLERYKIFAENNVRDLVSYNQLASRSDKLKTMPQILIVIDELSDLMMAAANEVEDAIIRLAQMARAAGMHLVIATQRPSVDVITGLIKANIPSRLALTVASQVDSRTILDASGAEKLLGKGDMLFMPVGMSKPIRVQGCFVSNREVESVVDFLKPVEETVYDEKIIEEIDRQAASTGKSAAKGDEDFDDEGGDEMLPQAIEAVIDAGMASTSMLQRKLRLGYARAGRLMDEMEQRGVIGPHEGSKPRQVLITRQQWLEMNAASED